MPGDYQAKGVRMFAGAPHRIAIRFDSPLAFDGLSIGQDVATWVAGVLSGGLGLQWLRGRQRRRASQDEAAGELTVRVLDEGATIRHELFEEARQLRRQLAEEMERRHQAELRAAQLEATNLQLTERVAKKDEHITSLLKLRGMADPEAGKASPEPSSP